MTLKLLLSRQNGRVNPGARLAGIVAIVIIAIYVIRGGGELLHIGGEFSFVHFNDFQSALILALVFLSMAWNFGFLLMAIDRLRNEVADLALIDDLTGVGNRRHLLQRLIEECATPGAQRRAVRAAGDRSRRLQENQRHPRPRRRRRLPAAFHADGADAAAARRPAGAHRRRRVLHRAAGHSRCARAR